MIAWSKFFKSYIKLITHVNDDNWSFVLCDENGIVNFNKPKILKANSSYKCFDWKKL